MATFNAISEEYERWRLIDLHYIPLQEAVVRWAVEDLAHWVESESDEIFEIGVGTGFTTWRILEALPPTARLVGVDPSSEMLTLAHQNLTEAGLIGQTTLLCQDVCEPLPMETQFQLAVSVCTLHNIDPFARERACRAIYDRLLPGGCFISGDKLAVNDPAQYLEMWDRWIRALDGFRRDGLEKSYRYWRDHELDDHLHRLTEMEQIRLLKEAGFADVQVVERLGMYAVVIAHKED